MTTDNRFGTDFILDDDNDIVLTANDDVMTTIDYENQKRISGVVVPFVGYFSVQRALHNLLTTDISEYPMDPVFGSELMQMLSQSITPQFLTNVRMVVSEELLKDDRVQTVESVVASIIGGNMVMISARVKLIGDDRVSELTFPEIIIP